MLDRVIEWYIRGLDWRTSTFQCQWIIHRIPFHLPGTSQVVSSIKVRSRRGGIHVAISMYVYANYLMEQGIPTRLTWIGFLGP